MDCCFEKTKMNKYTKEIITPNSPFLMEMIGQRIIDLGYYDRFVKTEGYEKNLDYTREGLKTTRKKLFEEFGWNISAHFSDFLVEIPILVLEKQSIAIFPGEKGLYPQLLINSNLTPERAESLYPAYGHYLYSVLQDPEMSNQMVQEMIGKKILGIDLIRLAENEIYLNVDNAYCILKLYLEGGMEKLIGTQMKPDLEDVVQVKNSNDIDLSIIGEVFPIRKEGYSID